MEEAITTSAISKVYNPPGSWRRRFKAQAVTAVDHVSIAVGKGELFGLLGPNGAGKTTLVKMLCALILPSSGTATIAGTTLHSERQIRSKTGLVVSDERSFYWRLSVQRNLDFFAAMYGLRGSAAVRRIATVLHELGLTEHAQQRFSDLSSGMRQRLAIARALLHQPQVLFLDEPTRSLDPIATHHLHDLILRIMDEREMTVFLITHDLAEAEKLCHRIALMQSGRIGQVGRPAELRRQLSAEKQYRLLVGTITPRALAALHARFPDVEYAPEGEQGSSASVTFKADESGSKLTAILDYLRQRDIEIRSIEAAPLTLELVFERLIAAGQIGER